MLKSTISTYNRGYTVPNSDKSKDGSQMQNSHYFSPTTQQTCCISLYAEQ